jgi:hypothetical protein
MADRIAQARARTDGAAFTSDNERCRNRALASRKTLAVPTDTMIDGAHATVHGPSTSTAISGGLFVP